MNNLINYISALFYVICLTNLLHSQTTYIFRDDSLKRANFLGRFENSLNQPYESIPFYDLKEKLPDGEYIIVNINKKDSARKELNKYIEIKGKYKDSLRSGRFEYYTRFKMKGKWKNKLTCLYTYKRGLLDGYYFSSNPLYKYNEGFYKEGNRHGFFIVYNFYEGYIEEVSLYVDGILRYRVYYKDSEMQPLEVNPDISNDFKIKKSVPKRMFRIK